MTDNGTTPAPAGTAKKRGLRPGLIVLIVALALVIIAIIQNWRTTQVSFLFWDLDVWIWLVIAVSAALGFVIGWVVHVQRIRAARKRR